jgi:hypothetical protein
MKNKGNSYGVGGIPRSFCMAQRGVGAMFCGRTFD